MSCNNTRNRLPWWQQTITVYNRYTDPITQVISWHRHTLDNCFWKLNTQTLSIGTTVIESTSIICRIPESDEYKEPYEWNAGTVELMQRFFTLDVGDIIIRGNVDDVIDEYTKGHRFTDILAKYKSLGAMQIKSVSNNTGACRGIPHYAVTGE